MSKSFLNYQAYIDFFNFFKFNIIYTLLKPIYEKNFKFYNFYFVSLIGAQKSNAVEVKDCFEGLNRATFAFNQGLDKVIVEPLARDIENYPYQ